MNILRKSLLILFFLPLSLAAQEKPTFQLTDTAFTVGSIYTGCRIHFDVDRHRMYPYSDSCLDTFAIFMLSHPGIVIEIGFHTDQRGSDSSNLKLSQIRASFVKSYLVSKGVSPYAVAAIGYGETQPIVKEDLIKKETDKSKREDLYEQNRRTEFKILRVPQLTFTLQDSVFYEGSMMRPNLVYDFSKCDVRPESYPFLDSLVTFLVAHPTMIIEIGNHIETRGSTAANLKITECRSRSVALYLMSKGIPEWRVIYKGYGESTPIIPESEILKVKSKQGQEEFHQVNRRTEIKILKVQ